MAANNYIKVVRYDAAGRIVSHAVFPFDDENYASTDGALTLANAYHYAHGGIVSVYRRAPNVTGTRVPVGKGGGF